MKGLRKHRSLLLGLGLLLAAAGLLALVWLPARRTAEREEAALLRRLDLAQREAEARRATLEPGESPEPEAEDLRAALAAWRTRLPETLREEEQIRFILELETLLGTEIDFRFGTYRPLAALSDGAELGALRLELRLETDAAGLAALLRHLDGLERPVTVHSAALRTEGTRWAGTLRLDCYLLCPAETE